MESHSKHSLSSNSSPDEHHLQTKLQGELVLTEVEVDHLDYWDLVLLAQLVKGGHYLEWAEKLEYWESWELC